MIWVLDHRFISNIVSSTKGGALKNGGKIYEKENRETSLGAGFGPGAVYGMDAAGICSCHLLRITLLYVHTAKRKLCDPIRNTTMCICVGIMKEMMPLLNSVYIVAQQLLFAIPDGTTSRIVPPALCAATTGVTKSA